MNQNKKTPASMIAFGGMMAALAVVIMSIGGMIPVATYISPMLCALVLQLVYKMCGQRIAWAWFGAVAILGCLMSPDKEAAGVFLFLGYYPIVKPRLEQMRFPLLWKLLLFNTSIGVLYFLLLKLMGMEDLMAEFTNLGMWMPVVLVLLGNVTFLLLDRLLEAKMYRRRK